MEQLNNKLTWYYYIVLAEPVQSLVPTPKAADIEEILAFLEGVHRHGRLMALPANMVPIEQLGKTLTAESVANFLKQWQIPSTIFNRPKYRHLLKQKAII